MRLLNGFKLPLIDDFQIAVAEHKVIVSLISSSPSSTSSYFDLFHSEAHHLLRCSSLALLQTRSRVFQLLALPHWQQIIIYILALYIPQHCFTVFSHTNKRFIVVFNIFDKTSKQEICNNFTL